MNGPAPLPEFALLCDEARARGVRVGLRYWGNPPGILQGSPGDPSRTLDGSTRAWGYEIVLLPPRPGREPLLVLRIARRQGIGPLEEAASEARRVVRSLSAG